MLNVKHSRKHPVRFCSLYFSYYFEDTKLSLLSWYFKLNNLPLLSTTSNIYAVAAKSFRPNCNSISVENMR